MFICESGLLFMTTPGAHDTAAKTLLNEGNNTKREQFMHVLVPVGDPSAFKVTSLQGYFPVALHVPITVVPCSTRSDGTSVPLTSSLFIAQRVVVNIFSGPKSMTHDHWTEKWL